MTKLYSGNRLPVRVARVVALAWIFLCSAPQLALAQDSAPPDADAPEVFVQQFPEADVKLNPINSFTTTEAQIYQAIHEGLVSYNPLTLDPLPAGARRWDISEDRLTYTFYLRSSARYSNGDRVTAEHFRDTWLKMLDPETEAEYSFLYDVIEGAEDYRRGLSTDPESVSIRALDELTLEVTLAEPATHFLNVLCHHSFVVVHPSLLNEDDWTDVPELPLNGPYRVIERAASEMRLTRNQEYWDADRVAIDELRFLFDSGGEELTAEFNEGEIHWLSSPGSLANLRRNNALQINPLFATTYFFFRATEAPWDDGRVRRALALLLPWGEIRNNRFQFIPTSRLVPDIPNYPDQVGIDEARQEEALRLLEEAGYPQGRGLPDLTLRLPGDPDSSRIAEIMDQRWGEVLGIAASVETVSFPEYFDSLEDPGYTLGLISWIGDFADPLTFLQMWTSGSNLNDAGFADEGFDGLIRSSMRQQGAERYDTLAEAERILLDSALVLPISHSPAINVIDTSEINGWFTNPLDIHPYRYLRFADPYVPPYVAEAGAR